MYISCLQNQEFAYLIIGVVGCQYLNGFDIAINVDLTLL